MASNEHAPTCPRAPPPNGCTTSQQRCGGQHTHPWRPAPWHGTAAAAHTTTHAYEARGCPQRAAAGAKGRVGRSSSSGQGRPVQGVDGRAKCVGERIGSARTPAHGKLAQAGVLAIGSAHCKAAHTCGKQQARTHAPLPNGCTTWVRNMHPNGPPLPPIFQHTAMYANGGQRTQTPILPFPTQRFGSSAHDSRIDGRRGAGRPQ